MSEITIRRVFVQMCRRRHISNIPRCQNARRRAF
nr:MAG TPA: hypothetical protein [Caudoviricetes sp.]